LIAVLRARDERVAVTAIDPSSPFTGGAILGDRVRLRTEHASDDGVFMRSLASRGQLGGLARAVPEAVRLLGAAGWPTVIVETVGVGQTEVSIASQADTTVVVVNPGWGDEVQANKAGLLEIADVLVVNKADRDGARTTVRDLRRMLDLAGPRDWRPPIVETVAVEDKGLEEVWAAVEQHRAALEEGGELDRRRQARLVAEVHGRVTEILAGEVAAVERSETGQDLLEGLRSGEIPPSVVVAELLDGVRGARRGREGGGT
jgi:LAO/AO transport system kinase